MSFSRPDAESPAASTRLWLPLGALIILVFLAFQPALDAGFIWDDDTHVTANPRVVGPLGLREIWSTTAANYFPLVLTHFRALHALWGLDPLPYHAVNLALHALAAILCWRVLLQLGVRGAWLGAALWAVHPVQVESVAWISELKNTQSAVFYLLAALSFIRWVQAPQPNSRLPRAAHYALALLFAVAAILSKPSTVMLPVALALCWWWLQGQFRWRPLLWLAPFFALSLGASAWTIWEQKYHAGALGAEWDLGPAQRVILAGRVSWFYLGKLLWPAPLVFVYPRWTIDAADILAYVPLAMGLLVLGYAWWRRTSTGGPVFLALLYFAALIFPVMGFFNVYYFRYSFVADHFQYLASIGPLALAAAGVATLGRLAPNWQRGAAVAAAALLIGLTSTSRQEARHYHSSETLFRQVIARNPAAWMAYNNLGNVLLNRGEIDAAYQLFQHAVRLKPDDAAAVNNIGSVLLARGDLDGAAARFEEALRHDPLHFDAHNNLASLRALQGRWADAEAHYREALRLNPTFAKAQYNWGNDCFRRGDVAGAVQHYEEAVRLEPGFVAAHYNLGVALAALSRFDEAARHYARTIELEPRHADAHHNLALLLQAQGRTAEAIAHYESALRSNPGHVQACNNLGTLLRKTGRPAEAIRWFEAGLKLNPAAAEIRYNLSLALRDVGRTADARAQYESARKTNPDLPEQVF